MFITASISSLASDLFMPFTTSWFNIVKLHASKNDPFLLDFPVHQNVSFRNIPY
jgi:hypothetical protein